MSKAVSDASAAGVKTQRSRLSALYYYATPLDFALIFIGCLGKLGFGIIQAAVLIVFGDFFDLSSDDLSGAGFDLFVQMCLFGGISTACEAIGTMLLEFSKNRQIAKWKKGYIKGVLRQEVGWYDVNKPQELSTRMGESLVHIEKGIAQSCAGMLSAGVGQFFGGIVIGIYYKWDLALLAMGVAAVTYVPAMLYVFNALEKRTKLLADSYGAAGGVASEGLSGLRTIASLSLETTTISRYEFCLRGAEKAIINWNNKIAIAMAARRATTSRCCPSPAAVARVCSAAQERSFCRRRS